ncbi:MULTISPECIES: DoxX family protein [Burkholderia]|uniref:Quinol oxidase n=1 Tax=Burkholderia savannae TaxID=1637837 RepID=A0ABR5T6N0_9BURK|nr:MULTISPECIES: DoxX family protein [Burkholderia]AOJ72223.1 quinol oxidase [Burkholderia savannae]AOJ83083.1 quinol oxidase [Burkholderia savannae]AOK50675.1 quinol oxidase [Burkholderia sp. MSMB617WGS]KGR98204.1 inner membrane protein yphA [Burkholderia sp. ABCPW 111]KVG44288.1 quinol oxidase [Burkholderia sp. MSMB0265]
MARSVDSGVIFFARLLLAVLFLWGGAMKLLGYGEFVGYLKGLGVPFTQVAAPAIVALEALGGLLLVVGYKVKPLALVLALYTIATALIGHNFWDATNSALQRDMAVHFWKNVAIAGGFLLLYVTGAGGASIDGARRPSSSYGSLR